MLGRHSAYYFKASSSLLINKRSLSQTVICLNKKTKGTNNSDNDSSIQNKTPLQVFFDTFKQEWEKSSELKEDIKALQDATGKMGESDAFKRAKEAYDKAQKGSSFVGKTLKQTGEKLGDVAEAAWESEVGKGTRKVVSKTAETIDKSFEPVRKTQAYKDISDVIDDGASSAYGGFISKTERRKKREADILSGKRKFVKANDEAPTALVTTNFKVGKPKLGERWENFKTTTALGKFVADLRLRWDESENGLISTIRTIFEKIGGFFAETERARVIKQFKMMDPTFNTIDFTKYLTTYIIPEVLDAYNKGDEKVLKEWFSEAPFNVWNASTKQYREKGLFADGKVLDIRGVDIVSAKLLPPADLPVLVVGCRAQEINVFRDAKSHKIMAGDEGNILLSSYAIVLTRIPEEMENKETEGWKIIEFARGGTRSFT